MPTALQWLAIFVFTHLTYWQPYPVNDYGYYSKIKKSLNKEGYPVPEGSTFGIVWFFLYAMVSVAVIYFFVYEDGNFERTNVVVFFSVYAVNMFFNKVWSLFFFQLKKIGLAFAITILIFATAVVLLVFSILEAMAVNKLIYVTTALLSPYVIWLIYAMWLNFLWLKYKDDYSPLDEPTQGRGFGPGTKKKILNKF